MSKEHLKFSTGILQRLGEELNPNPDQSIVELVRNSYDADALICRVELTRTHKPQGTIRISDDGIGMDRDGMKNGWLILGRSGKSSDQLTELGRIPVGQKGLGRLAALRMGTLATVVSRPRSEEGYEYHLTIDWSRYEEARVVEEVELDLKRLPRHENDSHGTTILLERIRQPLGRMEVKRLARSLILLADPFDNPTGFRPSLKSPEFRDLEKLVENKYFTEADYHLVATLDENGAAEALVRDWKGQDLFHGSHSEISRRKEHPRYEAPQATFELWVFGLTAANFSTRPVSIGEVKDWLAQLGGVHVYHRGLRVHPYGDPGHDWLDMNLLRTRNPEERPSTNNSIGRMAVNDPRSALAQKTDRTGFIENTAFHGLRQFAIDSLEWMARSRIRERDRRRTQERVTASQGTGRAKESVDQVIESLPAGSQPEIKKALREYERARDREVDTLRGELQLYRTLATVGTTSATFAHESTKPLHNIARMAKTIRTRGQALLRDAYEANLHKPVDIIVKSVSALQAFAKVTLNLLGFEKRRPGRVDVHRTLRSVLELFQPFFARRDVEAITQFGDCQPFILGSDAALESVLTNLLTNSLRAFERGGTAKRVIICRTDVIDDTVRLSVLDSGPGINGLKVDEIWLPGESTTIGGTGLGLTIVRDTVGDLGGSVSAVARGELGGAEIIIELPTLRGT